MAWKGRATFYRQQNNTNEFSSVSENISEIDRLDWSNLGLPIIAAILILTIFTTQFFAIKILLAFKLVSHYDVDKKETE